MSPEVFEISKSDLRAEISGSIYIQNSLKTKQNKVDYTIIIMSQNVIIRYRYKLFARRLARVGNLGSGIYHMS